MQETVSRSDSDVIVSFQLKAEALFKLVSTAATAKMLSLSLDCGADGSIDHLKVDIFDFIIQAKQGERICACITQEQAASYKTVSDFCC